MSGSLLFLFACASLAKKPAPPAPPTVDAGAAILMGQALQQGEAYEELVYLSDRIGARISGSPQLEAAVDYTALQMAADGLATRKEAVMVPAWIRGRESLTAVAPFARDLPILGLGGSIGTPDAGIEAEVVVASSFDELAAMPDDAIAGRIVLWDVPFTDYGTTVKYRGYGAVEAAKRGAVASLVRSVTTQSLNTPHTGMMKYEEGVARIPAAAVTIEDSTWMGRLVERGQSVRLRLQMEATFADDRQSHNVIGEVKGRELPDEVIVVGCHLDSWDVGQGAQDDGAGCVAAMEAVSLVAALHPKRTVRAVMFTNEENGLRGGKAYAEAHHSEEHVAALESDTGSGQPLGFRIDLRTIDDEAAVAATVARYQDTVGPLLEPIGAGAAKASFGGADISPLAELGVPCFGVWHDTTDYWPIHHTDADTVDKVDPVLLNKSVAAMAVLAWVLSEEPERVFGE